MQSTYKYLYVRTVDDIDDDDLNADSLYIPTNKITGILTTSTTAITIFFDSVNNGSGSVTDGNEVVISDSVVINVTAGKTKQVMQTIVRAINETRFSDGIIVLADDVVTTLADATISAVYLDAGISSCGAISVASKLS